jgi:mRNA interferase HigB
MTTNGNFVGMALYSALRHAGWPKIVLVLSVPFWDYNQSMNVIAVKFLRHFWVRYPDAEQPLRAWVDDTHKAVWASPADIKAQYRNASILKNRRVVFNIKGNDYRLVVAIAYRRQLIYVKFIGTHREYDAINADTVEI